MRLKTRIAVMIAASLTGLIIMGALGLYSMRINILHERNDQIALLLDFAKAQMAYFNKKEVSGELTREEAQAKAKEAIFAQQTKKDYFIVRDLTDNKLLVHKTVSRIGKIDPGGKMPDGRYVNEVYLEKIKQSPEGIGFVELTAKRPGSTDDTRYEKINGVSVFEPWNWIVVIGFFIDDVDAELVAASKNFVAIGSVLLVIMSTLTYFLIRSITRPLSQIQNAMLEICSTNNFTQTVNVNSKDEIGEMTDAFNDLLSTLRGTLQHFKMSVKSLFSSSENLIQSSEETATASNQTRVASSLMSASIGSITASINVVSENAKSASALARKAGELSGEGAEVIEDTVREMRQIADAIDGVGEAISRLGDQSDEISSIVQVIKEVADQTNLLALNAAIEAARAGETGRGFAVVADEVRKLAERTTQATVEISQKIGGIQTSSHSAVTAMKDTVEQVRSGRKKAEHAGESIIAIQKAAADVVQVIEGIEQSTAEQSLASQDISRQLKEVSESVEINSVAAEATSTSAHGLGSLATEMNELVEKYTV